MLIATLGGTAVGLERQWSGHADGPGARLGGIRTFTMLGGLAGLSGWLVTAGQLAAGITLLGAAAALIVISYAAASRTDVDATTEVAALVVLAAGVLSGTGSFRLASAIIALTTLLLVEKSRVHALVRRIDDVALRAAMRFAVMALVVLPLLPPGPYGPFGGIRPRELWALVLFFSGLSFLGFLARRVAGPGHGYLVTGLIGGMVSSTNVTLTFARLSREHRQLARELAFGAVAANAMLFPRVLVATAVLNPPLALHVLPYLAVPASVAIATLLVGARRPSPARSADEGRESPLQLSRALQMAALFQVVLVAIHLARTVWGDAGILTSAAILGLTDVDALTMSMSRSAGVGIEVAAAALAVGIMTNTALKAAIALGIGTGAYRGIAGGALAAMLVALLLPLLS